VGQSAVPISCGVKDVDSNWIWKAMKVGKKLKKRVAMSIMMIGMTSENYYLG
jgi:hypothetical protein